jgi:membrane associated rhomboid family serine protease
LEYRKPENTLSEKKSIEYRRFVLSLIPPAILVFLLWMVKAVELLGGYDFFYLGIYPRKIAGLIGIFLSPMIHANFSHLVNNSIPFFFMLSAIFYFYQKVAWRVLMVSYLLTGAVVWILARPSYHIGASGLIYSFGSFLFFSGIIRANINLLAISLLVSFLYGSMVWGVFPYRPDMSWESHLTGMVVGLMLAYHYRYEGPEPTPFMRDMDEEDEDGEESEYWRKDEESA